VGANDAVASLLGPSACRMSGVAKAVFDVNSALAWESICSRSAYRASSSDDKSLTPESHECDESSSSSPMLADPIDAIGCDDPRVPSVRRL
jgi:hypothetical protein